MVQQVHLALIQLSWRKLCTSFRLLQQSCAAALHPLLESFVPLTYICRSRGTCPLTARQLTALNKCPGVRPIGVGKTVRRILGKAIFTVIKTAGTLQLCAGQEAGNEAAIHAMCNIFEDAESEAVLLVNVSNAFNSLNHKAALYYIKSLCPPS